MHESARWGFVKQLQKIDVWTTVHAVLDLGGADVNGTVHKDMAAVIGPVAPLDVLDIAPGPGVTVVADARTYRVPDHSRYDLVISTEALEHIEHWQRVMDTAYHALKSGSWFVGTAAAAPRPRHGARGDAAPAPGEHYGNIDPDELRSELERAGFSSVSVTYIPMPGDVYWRALREY